MNFWKQLIRAFRKWSWPLATEKRRAGYSSLLSCSVQTLRYTESSFHNPYSFIVPGSTQQVQKSVTFCIENGWEICVCSRGHNYEDLSSTSDVPSIIIDLMNLDEWDWYSFQNGLGWGRCYYGQLYDAIADRSATYGFSAGSCITVATGGHFNEKGIGTPMVSCWNHLIRSWEKFCMDCYALTKTESAFEGYWRPRSLDRELQHIAVDYVSVSQRF